MRQVVEKIFAMEIGTIAYLSNKGPCVCFTYGKKNIRFMGPKNLQFFLRVTTWDKGYLVVDAKFSHSSTAIEDYIDLVPILENLYIDAGSFLKPIERVEVRNA